MEIIKIENLLPKEEIEKLDSYFNKETVCECGTTFKANVLDTTLTKDSLSIYSITYKATVSCPLCGTTYRTGYYELSDKDIRNIKRYEKYLRSKNKFDAINQDFKEQGDK